MPATSGLLQCVDWRAFSDDEPLGATYVVNGILFTPLGASTSLRAQADIGDIGLAVPYYGLSITFPMPVTVVTLRIDLGAGPVDVTAQDSTGTVVSTQTVLPLTPHSAQTLLITAQEIKTVEFMNGQGEVVVFDLCTL